MLYFIISPNQKKGGPLFISSYCEYPIFFSRIASALAFIAALRASRDLESSPVRPTPPTAAEAGRGAATAATETETTAAAPRRREERAFLREGAATAEAFAGAEEEEARTCEGEEREKEEVGVESFFLLRVRITDVVSNDAKAGRLRGRNCPLSSD